MRVTRKGPKTPYWIHLAGRVPFVMAGLWERWEPEGAAPLHSFTILTTEAAPAVRDIHPRMPVILPAGAWDRWLDPDCRPARNSCPFSDPSGEGIESYPVSSLVNSPRNDLPECIEPA